MAWIRWQRLAFLCVCVFTLVASDGRSDLTCPVPDALCFQSELNCGPVSTPSDESTGDRGRALS